MSGSVPALRLGLTGGIGSGKSSVGKFLQQLGATVLDADAIAREATAPQGKAIPQIAAAFGPTMIAPDGGLDRGRMRELAFTDQTARAQLEAIVHPFVGSEMDRSMQEAQNAGATCIVFDIPLLTESGRWRPQLHRILVVDCLESTQMARVVARDGLPAATVEKIMAAQATRLQRLAIADDVVFNEGIGLPELAVQVQQLAAKFGL